MENFNINNPLNQPGSINKDIDKPTPFDDSDPGEKGVSHAPLDLGGTSPVQIPKAQMPKPAAKKPAQKTASTDRIEGVKTFFTKLHPGALNLTNITTGLVQAKKTEPNVIITVWY